MTWDPDPLLTDEWPHRWSPLNVEIRPRDETIELVVDGDIDAWSAGALVRNVTATFEPSFTEIHLDLRNATGLDPWIEIALRQCREFASSHRARLRVTSSPPTAVVAEPAAQQLQARAG